MAGSLIRAVACARFCRTLGTLLHSGVPVTKIFEIAAHKTYDARCRRALANLARVCRGLLYFGVLTREDWEQNCNQELTDTQVYLRNDT